VAWQTAYHPEGVGIDCYGLMQVLEENGSRFPIPASKLAEDSGFARWGTQIWIWATQPPPGRSVLNLNLLVDVDLVVRV
jgi:hypothetical protein